MHTPLGLVSTLSQAYSRPSFQQVLLSGLTAHTVQPGPHVALGRVLSDSEEHFHMN